MTDQTEIGREATTPQTGHTPDLFQAAQAVEAWIRAGFIIEDNGGDPDWSRLRPLAEVLREAIAKATNKPEIGPDPELEAKMDRLLDQAQTNKPQGSDG